MRKFIQKTTSVFMTFTMAALIGAPAYATAEEEKTVYEVSSEIIESVVSDFRGEEENIAVEHTETAADETDIPPVCDHSNEEIDVADETETDEETEAENEPGKDPGTEDTEDPVKDEILDYIGSEEFQDSIEDAGVDSGVIEEEIEDGNYEIIYITREEFEQMRVENALSVLEMGTGLLGESLLMLLLIPAAPFVFFIPFVGPFVSGVIVFSPLITLMSLGYTLISPILAISEYKNYELGPGYEIIE